MHMGVHIGKIHLSVKMHMGVHMGKIHPIRRVQDEEGVPWKNRPADPPILAF